MLHFFFILAAFAQLCSETESACAMVCAFLLIM